MLLCNVLDPFPLTDIRASPQRHLIVFPTKMDKGNRETLSFNFDGEIGNVRRTLGERILLRQCLVIAVSVRPCSVVGVIVVGRYEEKLQWYWLCVRVCISQKAT